MEPCPVGYRRKDCLAEILAELENTGSVGIGNFCWENCLKTFFKFKEYEIEDEGTTIVVSKSN